MLIIKTGLTVPCYSRKRSSLRSSMFVSLAGERILQNGERCDFLIMSIVLVEFGPPGNRDHSGRKRCAMRVGCDGRKRCANPTIMEKVALARSSISPYKSCFVSCYPTFLVLPFAFLQEYTCLFGYYHLLTHSRNPSNIRYSLGGPGRLGGHVRLLQFCGLCCTVLRCGYT
jgi:hypothetical protein